MAGRLSLRASVSVAVGVVRAVAGVFGRYVPTELPLEFDALERARWAEMVEGASVYHVNDKHNRAA